MRHNKKRNTAFLYHGLVKELTKSVLRSDSEAKKAVTSILKEHFSSGSLLSRELGLYKALCETSGVEKDTAEKILSEVKRVYHSLGQEEIFDEQSEVIKKINTDLSKNVYSNFIPNYKMLATISQMFDQKTPISRRVILEQKVVETLTSKSTNRPQMKHIDNITYNVFVNKFNEKYGDTLNESQKILLSKYVTVSPDTIVEFKLYISDEINRLKRMVKKLQKNKDVLLDEGLNNKSKEILSVLESFADQKINDDMIRKILKVQALETEIK